MAQLDIVLHERKTGQTTEKTWNQEELIRAVPWLKRMNARGHDVLVRPSGDHGLVLLESVTPSALNKLGETGFMPTAVLETSPGRFQAWIKLSHRPLTKTVRQLAAIGLIKNIDGDLAQHKMEYGRLAGFTNQAPQHSREGRQPYVLVRFTDGQVAINAGTYLERISRHMTTVKQEEMKKQKAYKNKDF